MSKFSTFAHLLICTFAHFPYLRKVIELVKQKFINNKESFQLYLGSSLISVFNFLSIALLSHFLLPAEYGVFRYVLMLVSIAVALGSMGFAQSIYYYLQKSQDAQQAYNYINALRVGLVLSAVLVIIGLFIYQALSGVSNTFLDWNRFNIWIILLIIPGIFQSVELNIFLSIRKMSSYFVNTLSILSLKVAFIFIASTMKASLIHYVFILGITAVLPSIFNTIVIEKYFASQKFQIHLSYLKQLWKYGLPIGIGLLFGVFMSQADKMLLAYIFKDPLSIAIVSNGNFDVPLITVFYTSFSTIAFPYMVKAYQNNNIAELIDIRRKYQKEVVLILFPIVVAFIAWSPSFIRLAFGEYYTQSAALFAVYSITFFLRFNSYHDIFLITNRTKYISYIQGIEMVFHLLLTYFLIQQYGPIGASFAAVITNILYAFACIFISKLILNVRMIDIVPFWYLCKIVFIATAVMFPFYFIGYLFGSHLFNIITAGIYVISCILLLYTLEVPKHKESSDA